jgi:hypothetical protein
VTQTGTKTWQDNVVRTTMEADAKQKSINRTVRRGKRFFSDVRKSVL